MPLLKAGPGAIPDDHENCAGNLEAACLECKARHYLTPDDWQIVRFLEVVHDQIQNIAPGAETPCFVPRLEGWVAACDLYDVPPAYRSYLIENARYLYSYLEGRIYVLGVHQLPAEDLAPLEDDDA